MGEQILILIFNRSKVYESQGSAFKIAIGQSRDFMNIRDDIINAQIGFFTRILVSAVEQNASKAFEALDERPCRFPHEIQDNSSLYTFYSHASCIFECRLRFSAAACNCTPWNYPQYGNGTITSICDGIGAYCFEVGLFCCRR
jgi:hypothetical protein